MEISLDNNIYSKEAVLKTIYLFKEDFNIKLSSDSNFIIISIECKQSLEFEQEIFMSMLIEQQLRETLNSQNGSLRDLIYTKAFSGVE